MKIVRGDDKNYGVFRKDKNEEIILTQVDEMFITFKSSEYTHDILFQKKLSDGSIKFDEVSGEYSFSIKGDDTKNLPYGKYYFDIAIIELDNKRTLLIDELEVTRHYTFNEGEMADE